MKKTLTILCLSAIALSLSACNLSTQNKSLSTTDTTTLFSETSLTESTTPLTEIFDEIPQETENTESNSAQQEETSILTAYSEGAVDDNTSSDSSDSDVIRPEFKEAMDSYEEFFDEYCEFMKKYTASPNDFTLLVDYLDYMTKYTEMMEKLDEMNESEMTDSELKYYLEVLNRINQKLIDSAS